MPLTRVIPIRLVDPTNVRLIFKNLYEMNGCEVVALKRYTLFAVTAMHTAYVSV